MPCCSLPHRLNAPSCWVSNVYHERSRKRQRSDRTRDPIPHRWDPSHPRGDRPIRTGACCAKRGDGTANKHDKDIKDQPMLCLAVVLCQTFSNQHSNFSVPLNSDRIPNGSDSSRQNLRHWIFAVEHNKRTFTREINNDNCLTSFFKYFPCIVPEK